MGTQESFTGTSQQGAIRQFGFRSKQYKSDMTDQNSSFYFLIIYITQTLHLLMTGGFDDKTLLNVAKVGKKKVAIFVTKRFFEIKSRWWGLKSC